MKAIRVICVLLAGLFASSISHAASSSADVAHLHVQLVVPSSALVRGGPNNAGLYFKMEQGWHVYWKNAGDAGEPPRIQWTLASGITAGPLEFPAPQRIPVGPLMDYGYNDEALFPFQINVAANAPAGDTTLHAKVNWLVCREVCIPGKAELEIARPIVAPGAQISAVQPDASLYARWAARLPQALPAGFKAGFAQTAVGYRVTLITGQRETNVAFFPEDPDLISNPAPQKVTPTAKGATIDLQKDSSAPPAKPKELRGIVELSGNRAYEIAIPKGAPVTVKSIAQSTLVPPPIVVANTSNSADTDTSAHTSGLARILGLAFLGGIILNLMPCVFPVLFLKGLALVNSSSEERHKLRAHGLVYTLGILVSFWVLVGVLIALRSAGQRMGWGFQFQSPIFLFLMAGLLFFLGLSLAGQFEIGLSLTSKGGSLAAKHGYAGSFFTGVLAVIVATPCTAPFMGAAIGYALAQTAAVTFAVFTLLALGLAAPYLALSFQPAWTRLLPRPGAWMEILRQAVSIPIFGTVIWLAWVVAQAYGATMLAALLAAFLLLAIAGWFLGRWPGKGWAGVLAALFILCVVGLGIYSANALAIPAKAVSVAASGTWQPWSEDAVKKAQSEGHPVFVDFTAKWCLSCQVNERVALDKPEVMQAFEDAHVVLLKADWTQHDDAITTALQRLGRDGVPAYALYPPHLGGPTLLPEALTPGIVVDAIKSLPQRNQSGTTAQFVLR
ncbi:MAG: protein-disulfide reductase DsbD family protein [Acidobacteriota bacterium]